MLKFHLITDTHYYAYEKLGFSGHKDQTVVNESGAVIDAIFDKLLADKSTDLVLIAGDLCTGGDRVNHEGFIPKLRRLQGKVNEMERVHEMGKAHEMGLGKRVFAITASHDYYKADHSEDGPEGSRADMVYREELYDLYYDFGPKDAIAAFGPDPFSYVAQLAPGYRLLALNTDVHKGTLPGLCDWAVEHIAEAKAEGQFIFAMHHYPMLPPSPVYPLLAPGDMLSGADNFRERLADAGLRFVFTGHTHMQNIGCIETPAGNRLYEINTGAAVGCGAPIRAVVVGDESMEIATETIEAFDWDLQGKSVKKYLDDNFDRMLGSICEAANSDIEKLLDILNGEFRIPKAALMKHKFLLSVGGKIFYRLTLGGSGRLLLCKIPREVRKVRVKDLIMEVVRNIYAGDEPYSVETPMGAAVYALTGRLERLGRPLLKKVELPFESLQSFVMSLLYDGGLPDGEAVLPLK